MDERDDKKKGLKLFNRPKGTKVTLKKRNKAEREVNRYNKNLENSKKNSRVDRKNKKAKKKGEVETVTYVKSRTPEKTNVIRPEMTVTVPARPSYKEEDVRTGDPRYGREKAIGEEPTGAQAKRLSKARAAKIDIVRDPEGKPERAGVTTIPMPTKKTIPAVTETIPATEETAKKDVVRYDKTVSKPKKRKRKSVKAKRVVNGRVVSKIDVRQGKR